MTYLFAYVVTRRFKYIFSLENKICC